MSKTWLKNALPWLWSDDSISKHIRWGSALVAALVFGLGGWAATGKFVGAVIAQGSVAIDSNVKKVQHPTGGVVGQLYVHDGDHMTAGQILIRLDETASRADLEIVRLHSTLHAGGKLCSAFCSEEERISTSSGLFRNEAKNTLNAVPIRNRSPITAKAA